MSHQNDLLIAIRRMTRAIDLSSKQLVKTAGLTAPQLLVLQTLASETPRKPSDIAKDVYLSQATVTSIVDRLTKAGLTRREKDPVDGRVINVLITEAGEKIVQNAPPLLQDSFTKQFRALKSWEQTLLLSSLQRLAEMMDAESLDAAPILEIGEISESI